MKQKDKLKLSISRNWKFPGQMRLLNFLRPSKETSNILNNGIIWLEGEDIAIYTTANNYIENSIIATGSYEPELQRIIAFSVTNGSNTLDIGCNIGLQALRMSRFAGASGKVIAFEPMTYLRKKSEKNFHLNLINNISLLPFALSDKEDTLKIAIDENIYNQGTFSLSQPSSGNTEEIVNVKIGDHLAEIQSLDSLALIKIDVEGFEFNVMKGLYKTIFRLRPRIIFEYDVNYWGKNSQNIGECYSFLKKLNYSIYQISFLGCVLITDSEQITNGNLFCISDEINGGK